VEADNGGGLRRNVTTCTFFLGQVVTSMTFPRVFARAAGSGQYPNLAAALATAGPSRSDDAIFESAIMRLIDLARRIKVSTSLRSSADAPGCLH
jgi:hypothetical protein